MNAINKVLGSFPLSESSYHTVPNRIVFVAVAALLLFTAGLAVLRCCLLNRFRGSATPTPSSSSRPSLPGTTPPASTLLLSSVLQEPSAISANGTSSKAASSSSASSSIQTSLVPSGGKLSFSEFQATRQSGIRSRKLDFGSTPIIRQDAQPIEGESIPDYLSRVFNSYSPAEGKPRGFVFAGCDFLYRTPGVHPAVSFLEMHMDTLCAIGIKKIFLEQLPGFSEVDEDKNSVYQLYQYFQGESATFPERSETINKIIEMAKMRGIEVTGTEVFCYSEGILTSGWSRDSRLGAYNPLASALITAINEPFVVFVGAAHGKDRRGNRGVSEHLDCPCIGLVSETLCPSVLPGTNQFTAGEYTVDAVFSQ